MKDAGYPLLADAIAGITEQRTIVQLRHRGVADDARRASAGDMRRCYIDALGTVVERPAELHVGWVRVNGTTDFCFFLLCNPMHSCLIRSTCWRNYVQCTPFILINDIAYLMLHTFKLNTYT